jgi:hypothetical protein
MRTYQNIEQMAAQDYSIGLMAHYKPLAELVHDRDYRTIIEVGTAYGGNAFHLLLMNIRIASLICIDPYQYYPAMPGFVCQEEYNTLFQFAKDRLSPWPKVEILRLASKEAFPILNPVDLIFLDGSHEYEDVKWECENYSKLVKPGGVLSGHDYNIFEGVNKAVDEFAGKVGKEVKQLNGNIWYMEY